MICNTCSKQNPEGSVFCYSCGAKLREISASSSKLETKPSSTKIVLIVLVTLVILGLGFGFVFSKILSSTPENTLSTYTKALVAGDYATAYAQTTPTYRSQSTEQTFISEYQTGFQGLGGITNISTGAIINNGTSATSQCTVLLGNNTSEVVTIDMVKINNTWYVGN